MAQRSETRNEFEGLIRVTLGAIILIAFLQSFTAWIESIYRVGLIKTSMGPEIAGVGFVLAPLLVYLIPTRFAGIFIRCATAVLLASRAVIPFVGAVAAIPVAGLGVGCGLLLFCYFSEGRFPIARHEWRKSVQGAILFVVMARLAAWSFDASMAANIGTAALFPVAALVLWRMLPQSTGPVPETAVARGGAAAWAAGLGAGAAFLLLYLVASSPEAVSAWAGADHRILVSCTLAAWGACMLGADRFGVPSKGILIGATVLFLAALLGGICLHTVAFPPTPQSPPLWVLPGSALSLLPFYLAAALSAVLPFSLQAFYGGPGTGRATKEALPVLFAGLFLVITAILLIFTNIWGYAGPIGDVMRNKFYLPFLLAGIVLVGALAVVPLSKTGRRLALGLCALAIALAFANRPIAYGTPSEPGAKRLTVLTYNMQQGSAENADQNYYAQLAFIRSVNPDIIGLQESDTARPSGGFVNAALFFAGQLGYHYYYGPNSISGTFGTALLSRYPLENPRTFFTFSNKDEIGTAMAEITVAGRSISLFNNHPANKDDPKTAHVDALLEAVSQCGHVISVGDYNYQPDTPYYARLDAALQNAWTTLYPDSTGPRHPTIGREKDPDDGPLTMNRRIDHIFTTPDFTVEEAWYVPAPYSETDHPAHWAVLSWK